MVLLLLVGGAAWYIYKNNITFDKVSGFMQERLFKPSVSVNSPNGISQVEDNAEPTRINPPSQGRQLGEPILQSDNIVEKVDSSNSVSHHSSELNSDWARIENNREKYFLSSARVKTSSTREVRWSLLVLADEASDGDSLLGGVIAEFLESNSLSPPSEIFTNSFVRDGSAKAVMDGDENLLLSLGVRNYADLLVFLSYEEITIRNEKYSALTSSKTILELKILPLGDQCNSLRLSSVYVSGGATTDESKTQSVAGAFGKLADRLIKRLLECGV